MLNAFIALLLAFVSGAATLDWPCWGGPNGNFVVDGTGLPASFADSAPKKLWQRSLGDDGYSGIVTDGNLLYTMYRRGNEEVVVAMDPADGATQWEYAYDATFLPEMTMEYGRGPHVTPLILGNYIYTIGVLARMHALDKKTGKIVWWRDLYKDFPNSTLMPRGYCPSPIVYKDTIIVKLGGQGHAIVALNPKDGSVVWQKQDFSNSPSTPLLINVDGQDQLVALFSDAVVGLEPNMGELLWSYPHRTSQGEQTNAATPLWGPGNLLFISTAYNLGTSVLHLAQSGGSTKVDELWSSNQVRVHFTNAIRIGDYIYASNGQVGPAPMTAVDVKTGKVAWKDRTFGKANMVQAGGKVILLDEGGDLARVTLSPEGMQVLWRVPLLQNNAWTAPTLAGTKLYVRDRRMMMALDLQ